MPRVEAARRSRTQKPHAEAARRSRDLKQQPETTRNTGRKHRRHYTTTIPPPAAVRETRRREREGGGGARRGILVRAGKVSTCADFIFITVSREGVGQTLWYPSPRAGVLAPGLVPVRIRLLHGAVRCNPSTTHTRAHTLLLISNSHARDCKTISCLYVVRWTDTHSHQHPVCDYWESTN